MDNETIVSLATSNGAGAISIVRLSGELAYKISLKLTKREKLKPRFATLSNLYDRDNNILDESIVLFFENPKSYTGEDLVEFQTHGGSSVASLIIDEILKLGARPANPGEFTKRAVLNGKMDVAKAEAVSALINSKSKASVKLLARQLKGDLKNFVEEIKSKLVEAIAHAEVSIDYAEEDLPENILLNINKMIEETLINLEKTLNGSKRRGTLLSGFKVAIIGKPNAGKSSLLNSLLSYERAIVSDIEGTTRDMIEGELLVGDHLIKIIDTAGIRETTEQIEKIGIEYSKKVANEADLILAIFDNSREFDKNDEEILKAINDNSETPTVAVVNKIDLKNSLDTSKLEGLNIVSISAKEVIDELHLAIEGQLKEFDAFEEHTLISKRQIDLVEKTIVELKSAKEFLNEGSLELFSYHIQDGVRAISNLTKPYEYDEMLDVMFNDFCLGK